MYESMHDYDAGGTKPKGKRKQNMWESRGKKRRLSPSKEETREDTLEPNSATKNINWVVDE